MTTDPRARIEEIRDQTWRLPRGPAKLALLEEAVRLADMLEDVDLGYGLRHELAETATFSGRIDLLLVAFSWRLARFDREPERFSDMEILWEYKWVANNVLDFPEVPLPRVLQLFDDMERRFREAGSTMHAIWYLRRDLYQHMGDRERAVETHARYRKSRRDHLSDCVACVAHGDAGYHCSRRRWSRAIAAAEPLLSGRLSCAEQPHIAFGALLVPYLHLKRLDDARAAHQRGYKMVRGGPQFVISHAQHLEFESLVGEPARAKAMVERHLPGALSAVTSLGRFHFLTAAKLWTDRMLKLGKGRLKLRLPPGPPPADADGRSDLERLGGWFQARAEEIADRFDARNGTDAHRRTLDDRAELMELATD